MSSEFESYPAHAGHEAVTEFGSVIGAETKGRMFERAVVPPSRQISSRFYLNGRRGVIFMGKFLVYSTFSRAGLQIMPV
jgi:hypothetical protein